MNSTATSVKIVLMLFTITLIGCQSKPNYEAWRSEILELHKAQIDAHWNKNVDFLVNGISDNFVSVGNGEIRKPTKEELSAQFSGYLSSTTFTEYKDLCQPIIGFSKDGSLAWSVVQVNVAGNRKMDDDSERQFDTTWAWITLYERQGDRWVRTVEVSNSK